MYAGRFIREFSKSHGVSIPAIACFTATAKRDVREEILNFFKQETGQTLAVFEGGVERDNLGFEVQKISTPEKLERIHDLLSEQFSLRDSGSAIVFRSTRGLSESTAEYLKGKNWRVAYFHAGLAPSEKKQIQDDFLSGNTQVICATNAFGMGIDKDNVRLVIHGDTPGSLENYLQEAGRAGRDQKRSRCVLLFDQADTEWQFKMSSLSELTRRDISQVLRTLRKARRGRDEIVITPGEILRDEGFESDLNQGERNVETKVRTAVSWLERAGFLTRDENVTSVFQARLLVRNLEEARAKMQSLNLSSTEQALWVAILCTLLNSSPDESLTVDQIALLPEFAAYLENSTAPSRENGTADAPTTAHDYLSGKIFRILRAMAQSGLLKRDTLLNAFVHYKVVNHSGIRLQRTLVADRKLLDVMATAEPDAEGWMQLSIPLLNQKLLDEGVEISPEAIRQLHASLSQDGRGFSGHQGSIEIRYAARDMYRVKVNRSWTLIRQLAEKRRRVAELILETILAKIPPDTQPAADLLVAFSFEELSDALNGDLLLRAELNLKDIDNVLERGLMYLHEQRVITLQQGLAIFRSAMTIRFAPDSNAGRYKSSDYQPLEHHYKERIFQIHVMGEYARRALLHVGEGLQLVLAYFSLQKGDFIRQYFGPKKELLEYATTAQSFHRIVTELSNRTQIRIVTASPISNMLILAGPGSGKTKTVIHRCAYLLRVKRVPPGSILICCFNRQTAIELKHRLHALVGDDSRGVLITTYHSLAMRLLGYSFASSLNSRATVADLHRVIPEAVALLRGENVPFGLEPDEIRDRLLAGFQHVLVDEYQDIDADQYDLISAIAGRKLNDSEQKLSILAVGDDDQNIYGFRGANVQFIRRFREDYAGETHYLVENYRSTQNIITASNLLIAQNHDRMKVDQPIRINTGRAGLPSGGTFGARDFQTQGRVQVIRVRERRDQSGAAVSELRRLNSMGVPDWSSVAILGQAHADLARSLTRRSEYG